MSIPFKIKYFWELEQQSIFVIILIKCFPVVTLVEIEMIIIIIDKKIGIFW